MRLTKAGGDTSGLPQFENIVALFRVCSHLAGETLEVDFPGAILASIRLKVDPQRRFIRPTPRPTL